MNIGLAIDLIFLFVTVIFAVKGMLRGLMGEVISLVATVGGLVLAFRLADQGAAFLTEAFDGLSLPAGKVISMVVVFVVVVLLGALLTRVCRAFLTITSLTFLDRMLGLAAGCVKSVALLLVLFVLISMVKPLVPQEVLKQSRSMILAAIIWPHVAPYAAKSGLLPDEGSSYPVDTGDI
ncbi:Colicin V production protein [Dethiosulfovibrio peptidovorans DSM 11002]|uniref:Colicin V production protein n=1 Tax=Dethiosulfovibrio peptidovorans DSM 11002 TaxID=469381 RepID=D2Z2Q4_9BACT|nr:CvpA family protein [Dethiosulfovibrio peptidovorans]EFC92067.1 Colicin V production protein [Dethiosulfovibrio peptidovorans DSM 11002]